MDTPGPAGFVAAVVALRVGAAAKTRLQALPAELRRGLPGAMASDTLLALTAVVDQVLVVGDPAALRQELSETAESVPIIQEPDRPGLNAALSHGAAVLRARGAEVVVACVGDLPCLRAASIQRILAASVGLARSFVADHSGVGTTMLITRGTELQPQFEGGSAAAHRASGATALEPPRLIGVPDARQDVDTEIDLAAAYRLGLGPATAEMLRGVDLLRSPRSA